MKAGRTNNKVAEKSRNSNQIRQCPNHPSKASVQRGFNGLMQILL